MSKKRRTLTSRIISYLLRHPETTAREITFKLAANRTSVQSILVTNANRGILSRANDWNGQKSLWYYWIAKRRAR